MDVVVEPKAKPSFWLFLPFVILLPGLIEGYFQLEPV
jgi:hypothetical protein